MSEMLPFITENSDTSQQISIALEQAFSCFHVHRQPAEGKVSGSFKLWKEQRGIQTLSVKVNIFEQSGIKGHASDPRVSPFKGTLGLKV